MALSIAELELQTAEFLPAREVMGGKCTKPSRDCGCDGGTDQENTAFIALVQQNANNGGENDIVEVNLLSS